MCIVKNHLSLCCSSVCFYFDLERLQRKWFLPGKKQMMGSLALDPLIKALDLLYLAMHAILHQSIPMAIDMASKGGALLCFVNFVIIHNLS